jgi:ABC-type multidrug transport system ATPase subunit
MKELISMNDYQETDMSISTINKISQSVPGALVADSTVDTALTLNIENVGKQYTRTFWGLNDFTLSLGPGVLGLLGPNGAGKSTLMRILATITKPTKGRITWNGTDVAKSPDELRAVLGYLPQDFGVYPNLTPVEFLEYLAAIKGLDSKTARKRIADLLQVVNLVDARKRPLGGFSGGMKQRVGIAQALLNDPRLLIVDEPTAGLDPEERARFRNLLSDLSSERIVILSTHIVSDVEATAGMIALISKGRLLRYAAPETLLQELEGQVWEWVIPHADLSSLKSQYQFSSQVRRSDGIHVRAVAESRPAPESVNVEPNLEDVYLHTMNGNSQKNGER